MAISLLLSASLAEPPDKERSHIWLTPWTDNACQGVPGHAPGRAGTNSTRRSTLKAVHLVESWKDGGHCESWKESWNSFSSFSYTIGRGKIGGGIIEDKVPANHEGRGSDEKNARMCILEFYQGMKCGTRQPKLLGGWEEQKPIMVILNAISSQSVFFDCRTTWISDYTVPHLGGENTN
ncbi:hypothetical protein Slin14017_G108400 [Septoria linicola]|nr:hypothetical protein Slin14017_G108400 [Septoria linicola]